MIIKEYRIVLPLTVEEYQIGQLYSIAKASKKETRNGDGVEVLKNEPFENIPLSQGKYYSGQYTKKIYHLASKVPSILRLVASKSCSVHEESWNAYPYCRTVLTKPGFPQEHFIVQIESIHCSDRGEQDNVHELSPETLRLREVEVIDIGADPVKSSEYKETEDPTRFKSAKSGRGPLVGDWRCTVNPVMCAYKLVTVKCRPFMLPNSTIESYILDAERKLFLNFHRQVFCWLDEWCDMTMDDIRNFECETKEELDKEKFKN